MSFIPWGGRKNYHSWQKMVAPSWMILILQVSFHSVFGNKTGPSGIYKAPDLLDNLRYDYGGGSGHLPVVPNIFGTGDQFPKAVFTGTGLERGMGQVVMLAVGGHRWSFTCTPATHLLLCPPSLTGQEPVPVCSVEVKNPCSKPRRTGIINLNRESKCSVQLLSHVQLFVTLWTAARQASLSIANSRSLLKLVSIEPVMPSSHLILCHPLLLMPSIFPTSGSFQMSHIR